MVREGASDVQPAAAVAALRLRERGRWTSDARDMGLARRRRCADFVPMNQKRPPPAPILF